MKNQLSSYNEFNFDWNRNFREESDNITKVIDQILDITVREYVGQKNSMLQDVYFTKYSYWNNYCLVYKMRGEYNNLEVLFAAVLESTDDILKWCDITEFTNFNVYIITPNRTYRLTYLDLLYEYVTMNRRDFSNGVIYNHPRIRKMKRWALSYRNYERWTKKAKVSNYCQYTYRDVWNVQREFLELRYDNGPISQEYRGLGYGPSGIESNPFQMNNEELRYIEYQAERLRQYYNGGYNSIEPVEDAGFMTRLRKKIKF